jgi:RNA polymerase sigma-70 factor (ECF subfamily)
MTPRPDATAVLPPVGASPPGALTAAGRADMTEAAERLAREQLDFVFRSLRRLGVAPGQLDDAVQDVFVVALRRDGEFEGRSSHRTWLFGIAQNVARDCRRRERRSQTHEPMSEEPTASAPSPFDQATSQEALRVIDAFLLSLDDDKRGVFIMAELEQIPVPEIARALSANVNTVYSRLRAARQAFTALLEQRFTEES